MRGCFGHLGTDFVDHKVSARLQAILDCVNLQVCMQVNEPAGLLNLSQYRSRPKQPAVIKTQDLRTSRLLGEAQQ